MLRRADRHPSTPILTALALLAVLGTVLVPAASAQAAGAAPGKVPAFSRSIDAYAPYVGQTVCSPTPKPGTLKLQKWLMTRYPGTGSSGIARACSVGGRSEHKEGRGFDWRVNVHNAKQSAQVNAFLKLAFASDKYGNLDAIARRMGLMYLIWNDKIYSASSGFVARPYHHYACKTVAISKCGDTLRHRDHVHISLSWAGARALTSFWDGSVSGTVGPTPKATPKPAPKPTPKTTPKPAPKPTPKTTPKTTPKPAPKPTIPAVLDQNARPVVSLAVPSTSAGVKTSFSLQKGTRYRLVATGYYSYGEGTKVADAACTWHRADDAGWAPTAEGTTSATGRKLVVGTAAGWVSTSGGSCDSAQHAYVWDYVPAATGPVTVKVDDVTKADNKGTLTVRVLKAGGGTASYSTALPATPAEPKAPVEADEDGYWLYRGEKETLTVSATTGGRTEAVLREGRTYRIRVEGTWSAGEGIEADAECTRTPSGTWQRKRSSDPLHPNLDTFDLYVDGVDLGSNGCSADHVYEYEYTPERDGRATFALWDTAASDNSGSVKVTVERPRA